MLDVPFDCLLFFNCFCLVPKEVLQQIFELYCFSGAIMCAAAGSIYVSEGEG